MLMKSGKSTKIKKTKTQKLYSREIMTTQAAKAATNSQDATKQQLLRNTCMNKSKKAEHEQKAAKVTKARSKSRNRS